MPSAAGKLSLEYRKAYIQQIEILHYIDCVRKKDDLNTVVQVVALLYSATLHPSDQHVVLYYNYKYFWKIQQM